MLVQGQTAGIQILDGLLKLGQLVFVLVVFQDPLLPDLHAGVQGVFLAHVQGFLGGLVGEQGPGGGCKEHNCQQQFPNFLYFAHFATSRGCSLSL